MDEKKLKVVEDHIGRSLTEAEKSGELRRAKDWGKPLDLGDGYDETPPELRMGYKVLKDAGVVPPEVELMRQLAELKARLEAMDAGSDAAAALRKEIVEMQLRISLRLERVSK